MILIFVIEIQVQYEHMKSYSSGSKNGFKANKSFAGMSCKRLRTYPQSKLGKYPIFAESSSDNDSEENESETDETDTDDVDKNDDESGDSDNGDDEDEDEDEEDEEDNQHSDESSDDEEEEESDSDSDIEIPTGPINLLMGGLPLCPSSTSPDDRLGNT